MGFARYAPQPCRRDVFFGVEAAAKRRCSNRSTNNVCLSFMHDSLSLDPSRSLSPNHTVHKSGLETAGNSSLANYGSNEYIYSLMGHIRTCTDRYPFNFLPNIEHNNARLENTATFGRDQKYRYVEKDFHGCVSCEGSSNTTTEPLWSAKGAIYMNAGHQVQSKTDGRERFRQQYTQGAGQP